MPTNPQARSRCSGVVPCVVFMIASRQSAMPIASDSSGTM
jgi:hypothetical protein